MDQKFIGMGNNEEENNKLHFSVVPYGLKDGNAMRAVPQNIYFVTQDVFIREVVNLSGTPQNVVETVLSTMCATVSDHCQKGHGIKLDLFESRPTLKGSLGEEQTVLHYPDQKVNFNLLLGKGIDINYEKIETKKVDAQTHVIVIDSVEDGISETTDEYLTSNGTGIMLGTNLAFSKEMADEGITIFTPSERIDVTKIYLNSNKSLQFRIPQLTNGEKYEIEVRKRFSNNKKLYSYVFPAIFTGKDITNE